MVIMRLLLKQPLDFAARHTVFPKNKHLKIHLLIKNIQIIFSPL